MLLCLLQGAAFLALKTTGDLRERARRVSRAVSPTAAAGVVALVIWTHVTRGSAFFLSPVELLAVLAVIAAWRLVREAHDGFAFAATVATTASCIVTVFVGLYPRVLVSRTSAAYDLTVHNTAAGGDSLTAMTVVVAFFLPLVLAYQGWTYYVFRQRISRQEFLPSAGVTRVE